MLQRSVLSLALAAVLITAAPIEGPTSASSAPRRSIKWTSVGGATARNKADGRVVFAARIEKEQTSKSPMPLRRLSRRGRRRRDTGLLGRGDRGLLAKSAKSKSSKSNSVDQDKIKYVDRRSDPSPMPTSFTGITAADCGTPILNDDEETTPMGVPILITPLENDSCIPVGKRALLQRRNCGDAHRFVKLHSDSIFSLIIDALGSMTQPANGRADALELGVLYTPNTDFCGIDTFTYSVGEIGSDQGLVTATVTINVVCGDSINVGALDGASNMILYNDEATTPANTAVLIPVLDNDENIPAGELFATVSSACSEENVSFPSPNDKIAPAFNAVAAVDATGSITDPEHGTTSFSGLNVRYTPETDFCGRDQFSYTVADAGGYSDTATVTINVDCGTLNAAEDPSDDDYYYYYDETPVVINDFVLNDDAISTSANTTVLIDVLNNDEHIPEGE